jgi:hypothetical protein
MFNRQDDLMPTSAEPMPQQAAPLAPASTIPPAIEAKMLAVTNGPENESYAIQSDSDFHRVADVLVKIKDAVDTWEKYWDPLRERAHAQWKDICSRIKAGKDPLVAKQNLIINEMGRWDQIQEQRRQAEQERKNAEMKKQMDDQRIAQATALADQGKHELADQVIAAPPSYAPPIEPKADRPTGLTAVRPWKYRITDKRALILAALDPKSGVPLDVILFDEKVLQRMAVALKANFNWPGAEAYQETNFARKR